MSEPILYWRSGGDPVSTLLALPVFLVILVTLLLEYYVFFLLTTFLFSLLLYISFGDRIRIDLERGTMEESPRVFTYIPLGRTTQIAFKDCKKLILTYRYRKLRGPSSTISGDGYSFSSEDYRLFLIKTGVPPILIGQSFDYPEVLKFATQLSTRFDLPITDKYSIKKEEWRKARIKRRKRGLR